MTASVTAQRFYCHSVMLATTQHRCRKKFDKVLSSHSTFSAHNVLLRVQRSFHGCRSASVMINFSLLVQITTSRCCVMCSKKYTTMNRLSNHIFFSKVVLPIGQWPSFTVPTLSRSECTLACTFTCLIRFVVVAIAKRYSSSCVTVTLKYHQPVCENSSLIQ